MNVGIAAFIPAHFTSDYGRVPRMFFGRVAHSNYRPFATANSSDYTARNMRLNLLVLLCLPILTVLTHAQWDLQDSHTTDKRTPEQATLLEAVSKPRCYGLDCPPWPTPPNIAFCFRAGDRYYVGTDRSWGVLWANKARKLQNLKGESVKILVTDKEIMVVDPQVRLRLWIAHQYRVFSLDSCNHT